MRAPLTARGAVLAGFGGVTDGAALGFPPLGGGPPGKQRCVRLIRKRYIHPSIAFSRGATGRYWGADGLLHTAAINEPRFEYDASGNYQGLLLESAGTNRALRSDDLTNASWAKTNATAALDQVDLFGTANAASSIVATAGNATVLQSITLASGDRIYSVYLKRLSGSGTIQITIDGGGTWTTVVPTSSYAIFSVEQTLANPQFGIRIVTNGDSIAVAANQVEAGPQITSYIPTAASNVTRATDFMIPDDVAAFGIKGLGATLYAEGDLGSHDSTVSSTRPFLWLTNAGATERMYLSQTVGINLRGLVNANGNVSAAISYPSVIPANTTFKAAFAAAADNFMLAKDGTLVGSDYAGLTASVPMSLLVGGNNNNGSSTLNGHIKEARYYPQRLSDGALLALTT